MQRTPDLKGALDHVKKVLKIEKNPPFLHLSLAKDAIPQYPPLYDKVLEEVYEKEGKKVTPIGSSYTGVSVNECIHAAKKAAYSLSLSP